MYPTVRYHLTLSKKRTTISMDKIISDLIAIKLGFTCGSKDTHTAVRKQLEKLILPYQDPESLYYSPSQLSYKPTQFVINQAILWLAGEELTEKYCEYKLNEYRRIK
jgi:hypothetical protein